MQLLETCSTITHELISFLKCKEKCLLFSHFQRFSHRSVISSSRKQGLVFPVQAIILELSLLKDTVRRLTSERCSLAASEGQGQKKKKISLLLLFQTLVCSMTKMTNNFPGQFCLLLSHKYTAVRLRTSPFGLNIVSVSVIAAEAAWYFLCQHFNT